MPPSKTALLLIDIQNDFMPGGALPVTQGDQILAEVNRRLPDYPLIVASQDWHPHNHQSFASQHPRNAPFDEITLHNLPQTLWPDHCIQGSSGADFHPALDHTKIAAIFRKGMNPEIDSYSAFHDNGHHQHTGLTAYLKSHQISALHIAGLAADFCVYFSIVDALEAGFSVTLIESATRCIDPDSWAVKKAQLQKHPDFHLA